MKFEATIKSIGALKTVIDVLTSVIDEAANFIATPEGFGIKAMDPSHISMVDLGFPKKAFETYKCDKKVNIGLNISNLNKILKRINSSSEMKIQLSEEGNKLNLIFGEKTKRRFTMNLIDLEEEEFPEPKIVFNSKVVLDNPSLLNEALKDAELFSDHTKISASKDLFAIFAKGDNGDVLTEIPGTKDGISITIKEDSESLYPLSYLITIAKMASVSHRAILEFSSEMPMQILFNFKPKDSSIGYCRYFLAPRVEEEEIFDETSESEDEATEPQETEEKDEVEEPEL